MCVEHAGRARFFLCRPIAGLPNLGEQPSARRGVVVGTGLTEHPQGDGDDDDGVVGVAAPPALPVGPSPVGYRLGDRGEPLGVGIDAPQQGAGGAGKPPMSDTEPGVIRVRVGQVVVAPLGCDAGRRGGGVRGAR